jgi:hypothetical protein
VANISAPVEAPDRERAEAVAIKQFALDDDLTATVIGPRRR